MERTLSTFPIVCEPLNPFAVGFVLGELCLLYGII